jgi:hypothetical protein
MKNFVLYGGIALGLLGIIVTGITYFIGVEAMVSLWTAGIELVLFVGLYIYLGLRFRKLHGGYLSYKDSFTLIFFMSVISYVITGLFLILLYHVINPSLPEKLQDATIQKAVAWMQKFDVPQDKIDEQIGKMQGDNSQFSIGSQLRSIPISFIISAIIALLLALFIRKNPPPFQTNTLDDNPPS